MWIKQYIYPFTDVLQDNKIILSFNGIKFVQIGIEYPYSIPIFSYNEYQNNDLLDGNYFDTNNEFFDIKVKISDNVNNITASENMYKINSFDILEFNNLNKQNLVIEIPYPENPYTIITIAYEKEED